MRPLPRPPRRGAFLGGLLTQAGRAQSPSPSAQRINNILWLKCLRSVPGHSEGVAAGGWWGWAEGLPRSGLRRPLGVPFSLALLAWNMGLREEAVGPLLGLPVQMGTAGLSSSPSGKVRLKMRWSHCCSWAGCWPPCLGCRPPPALLEGRGREAHTDVKHGRRSGRA